jgi:phospholipid-binding lipoprotein MlaA
MRLSPFGLLLATTLLGACAALPPGPRDAHDRFERVNRSVYGFNAALDRGVARPVAKAYVRIVPAPLRTGVSNFFENLDYTTTVVNDLLQAKPLPFVHDTARLLVNTTIGIGGLFDPATKLGMPTGDEDFGQTLGRWGVPTGQYLMLPVLGPSTSRDLVGKVGDHFTDPSSYVNNTAAKYGLKVADLLDKRAGLLQADSVLDKSYDPYVFVRSAYLQRRQFQVKDGNVSDDDVEITEDEATEQAVK